MRKLIEEFKKFALKGNMFDMAVGVVIGTAFGKIVTSIVNDLIMPLLSLLTGGVHTSGLFLTLGEGTFKTAEEAAAAGVATLNYGMFLQTIIDFFLVAVSIFMVVKVINRMHKPAPPAPAPRLCPFCRQPIDDKATRCPHCTSELPETVQE